MAGKDGKWDRGSAILIEVEFKRQAPFGSLTLFDPSGTPTITVTDEAGTVVVTAQDLVNSAVGQWYYNVQSTESWIEGNYRIKIDSTDSTNSDVTIEPRGFELV